MLFLVRFASSGICWSSYAVWAHECDWYDSRRRRSGTRFMDFGSNTSYLPKKKWISIKWFCEIVCDISFNFYTLCRMFCACTTFFSSVFTAKLSLLLRLSSMLYECSPYDTWSYLYLFFVFCIVILIPLRESVHRVIFLTSKIYCGHVFQLQALSNSNLKSKMSHLGNIHMYEYVFVLMHVRVL